MNKKLLLPVLMTIFLVSCATSTERGLERQERSHPMPSFIGIYRSRLDHLSAVRAGECPMHPSCSEYSAQAFEKHGFCVGWMMTLDRLMRCGRDDMDLAPLVRVNGTWKRYDPLDANDFWWGNPSHSAQDVSLKGPLPANEDTSENSGSD